MLWVSLYSWHYCDSNIFLISLRKVKYEKILIALILILIPFNSFAEEDSDYYLDVDFLKKYESRNEDIDKLIKKYDGKILISDTKNGETPTTNKQFEIQSNLKDKFLEELDTKVLNDKYIKINREFDAITEIEDILDDL